MKYSCNLIQDLLPLYYDGVCSQESCEIIEAHLSECLTCRNYLAAMHDSDKTIPQLTVKEREQQKAVSFQTVKKKLKRKQLLIVIVCIALLLLSMLTCAGILKKSNKTVIYDGNISVSMVDKSLVSRLKGSVWNSCKSVTVTTQMDGKTETYLFFCLKDTMWDDLITNSNSFSEYTLCPADKGAGNIDCVFYYIGDYDGISTLEPDELNMVINNSVLLWSR